jgi:hypothetical protein
MSVAVYPSFYSPATQTEEEAIAKFNLGGALMYVGHWGGPYTSKE